MRNVIFVLFLLCVEIGYAAECSYPTYSNQYGRSLSSFTLSDGAESTTISVFQDTSFGSSIYYDRSSMVFTSYPGTDLRFSGIAWLGSWMHSYLYIDYDKNGEFDMVLNVDGTGPGELVSYSYLDGQNSKGEFSAEGGGVSASVMPSFSLPLSLAEGDYAARFKIDWNNIDPCGASDIGANGGIVVDFTIRIASLSERTVSVKSSDLEKGMVAIEGEEGTSVTKSGPVTVVATPHTGFSFASWTKEGDATMLSSQYRYTVVGNEDVSLVANFTDLTYPVMTRTFTNNASQENRYLVKVMTKGTKTPIVFSCSSQSELPYTAFSVAPGNYTTSGALIDKTSNPIVVDQGVTSFEITYFGWQNDIGTATKQLDWAQDAYFVDWNKNGLFTDENEISGKNSSSQQNTAIYDVAGYTRSISIPANQPSGTYRMRVVFYEPETLTDQWQNTLFTQKNNQIRNGISYDFDIQILPAEKMSIQEVELTNNRGRVSPGREDVVLASVNVKTSGSLEPIRFTQFEALYTGTTIGDINNVRLVYSPQGNSVTGEYLADAPAGESIISMTVDKKLEYGDNHFLLVANVSNSAVLGNEIKVSVKSIMLNGEMHTFETEPGEGGYIVQNVADYTLGNAIWFDMPTSSVSGLAVWNKNDFSATATNPDEIWERKSFPIGNGSFGGNILGSVSQERIVLNEKTLWKGGPGSGVSTYWDMNNTVSASTLESIRSYLEQGRNSSAASMVSSHYKGKIGYEKSQFGTYTTMGEAYIQTGIDESAVRDYKRIMNIDSSLVVVQFSADGVDYQRKYFCSYPDSVMVWRFTSEGGSQNLTFSFECPQHVNVVMAVENGLLYDCSLSDNGMNWAMRVYARTNGGGEIATDALSRTITVSGSTDVEFIVAADTDYKMNFDPDMSDAKAFVGVDPVENVNNIIDNAKDKTYGELYDCHRNDYCRLFDRVDLSINPDESFENLPTPARLANYRTGTLDHGLEQIYFQYGRYLLISSSRAGNMPANLQGMWHNNIDGPWRVDYHNNINLQMNYWPATCTNLLECFTPFIDYVRGLVKPGERTAQAYYGARGWTAEVSTNIFGFTAPLNASDMSWNYNPTAGPWLATQIWEYYDYTRDKEWLRNVGYDIIKSSANFVTDLLYEVNGTYTSAPSYSPEHGTCDLGATYANAVTREVLGEAIKAAEILEVDEASVAEWREKLDKMYPYKVGRYGQLQEWYSDIDTYGDTHRHTNHLFGLHPGTTINPNVSPVLAEACKETLRQRGDAATGWSMGWKLNHWARLQDGDHAYILFQNLLKEGTADNLWDLHPPFQIDGNFGGTAGVSELFLQSQADTLYVLPALPAAWVNGHITGLLARGNFEVDIYYVDNRLDYAEILSNKGEECRVRYKQEILVFPTEAGESYVVRWDNMKGKLSYSIATGVENAEMEKQVNEDIQLYPNPNDGNFSVCIKGNQTGKLNLTIFSALGEKINEIAVNKGSEYIEVPVCCNGGKGYYVLHVWGDNYSKTKKFVVE